MGNKADLVTTDIHYMDKKKEKKFSEYLLKSKFIKISNKLWQHFNFDVFCW